MRVISGIYKNKKLMSPEIEGTHPMGDREKLALFNMIGDEIKGATVLDAYCGSGALGIEAVSRGAREVLFVEDSHVAMRTANMNCMFLGIPEEQVAFYRGKVSAFYKKIIQGKGISIDYGMAMAAATFPREYDIIIADPPYDDFDRYDVADLTNALKDGGMLALSHPGEAPNFNGLTLETTRKYADAHISIYRK